MQLKDNSAQPGPGQHTNNCVLNWTSQQCIITKGTLLRTLWGACVCNAHLLKETKKPIFGSRSSVHQILLTIFYIAKAKDLRTVKYLDQVQLSKCCSDSQIFSSLSHDMTLSQFLTASTIDVDIKCNTLMLNFTTAACIHAFSCRFVRAGTFFSGWLGQHSISDLFLCQLKVDVSPPTTLESDFTDSTVLTRVLEEMN